MAHRRAEVEETSLYAKKFVRYEEGAKKYSMGLSKFQTLAREAKEIRNHREQERKQMEKDLQAIFSMNQSEREKRKIELKGQKDMKISKISARTFF